MRSDYGTHSFWRTKASIIYRATGSLRAVQILLGYSKIENTVRYLGIDVKDALALAKSQLWHASTLLFTFFLTEACTLSVGAMGGSMAGSLVLNGVIDLIRRFGFAQ